MNNPSFNYENMSPAEFEQRLPDLFASGSGRVSDDPGLRRFLDRNPTCSALVSDLEYIADAARQMFETSDNEPSEHVWSNIQDKLKIAASAASSTSREDAD